MDESRRSCLHQMRICDRLCVQENDFLLHVEVVPNFETQLILLDLAGGKNRLGSSILHQVYLLEHGEVPDLEEPNLLANFFRAIQDLNEAGKILAYHDRSDGGLAVTLAELMFASRVGVTIDLDVGSNSDAQISALFSEELGAVIQIHNTDKDEFFSVLGSYGLEDYAIPLGGLNDKDALEILSCGRPLIEEPRSKLQRTWSKISFNMQSLRDNPDCAQQEYDSILDESDPGLHAHLTFDINDSSRTAFINKGIKPKIAILREQGINGHMEMAAAFYYAGLEPYDVHMSDIVSGKISLTEFQALAACGGFSFGDVLGAGQGWAKSVLFNPKTRDQFEEFFHREDTLTLGVCNGCQMLSSIREIIPGTEHWPTFVKNDSEQFEARFLGVSIEKNNSPFFQGMEGSILPISVAHGEGKAQFRDDNKLNNAIKANIISLKYVDNYNKGTLRYPFNPNGSELGITGLNSTDGRISIMMPHPERVFRTDQNSWHPKNWNDFGPWYRMFANANKFFT